MYIFTKVFEKFVHFQVSYIFIHLYMYYKLFGFILPVLVCKWLMKLALHFMTLRCVWKVMVKTKGFKQELKPVPPLILTTRTRTFHNTTRKGYRIPVWKMVLSDHYRMPHKDSPKDGDVYPYKIADKSYISGWQGSLSNRSHGTSMAL